MGWIPAASIVSFTAGYSHSQPVPCFSVIPVIRHAARWWNSVSTLSIYLVTTQLSLTYNSTDWYTALYISPWARTVAPVLSSTLAIMPHCLWALCRFSYTAAQSLLLQVVFCPRYGNASDSVRVSTLILNETLLALMHCCRVLLLRHLSSPCLHFSNA